MKIGAEVSVTITGTLEYFAQDQEYEASRIIDSAGVRQYVYPSPVVEIKSLPPEGWPPRPGDLWRDTDTGVEYFARHCFGDVMRLMTGDHNEPGVDIGLARDALGALVLVYRVQ